MERQRELLRSYVDPSTNEMLIADFNLPEYLNWLKGRPVKDSQLLANFLHEWTHRWCFDSLVGAALALLKLRAGTRVLLGESAFDDYVRTMTAMSLLEPMAEGLSLYAEFDAYPGESPVMSQTLAASSLFFSPVLDTDGRPELLLYSMLQILRRDPALLERKASIFLEKGFNRYLIGYLSVKALWKSLIGPCNAFLDRDLFLSYLRSYFYDDPGLAVAILKDAPSEVHAAENIANHLLKRTSELLSFKDLDTRVERWIASVEKGAQPHVRTIGSDRKTELKAHSLLTNAFVEDFKKGGWQEQTAVWAYMVIEERSICLLGKIAVDLERGHGNEVRVIDRKSGEEICITDVEGLNEHSEGQLYVIAGKHAHGLMSIVVVDRQSFLVSSLGGYSARDLELAKRFAINQPISNDFIETIRQGLEKDDLVNMIWNFFSKSINKAENGIYGPLCTLNASELDWPVTFLKIQELGLHGMLGSDAELTRAVAGVGLLNSISLDVEIIKPFARLLEIESDALERALQIDKVFGLPVIAKSKNSVLALV